MCAYVLCVKYVSCVCMCLCMYVCMCIRVHVIFCTGHFDTHVNVFDTHAIVAMYLPRHS